MLDDSVFFESSAPDGSGSEAGMLELGKDGGCEDGDMISAGSRWPREETVALLNIRSDMDIAFRDSTPRAPLWDEVSRKLAELDYHRSAKKCKEKFENIFKYHKRTKEARTSKHNAKNYRFFEQLELLDSHFSIPLTPSNQISSYSMETIGTEPDIAMAKALNSGQERTFPCPNRVAGGAEVMSGSTSTEPSSSEKEYEVSNTQIRKLVDYFERLVKDVLEKQEKLQNKFLEALEKCEKEQIAREEAWKLQEIARIKNENRLLAQERSISAAKDAAVIAFLQKLLTQNAIPVQMPDILTTLFDTDKPSENLIIVLEKDSEFQENDGVVGESSDYIERQDNSTIDSTIVMSSLRWPKPEIEALIMLKTEVDLKFQGNGAKVPLWEEISTSMKKLGYDRTAKRCKEKWENINKYYKRVKDSNKRRPEDSKTCPYFNLLDSVYAKKTKKFELMKPEQILMQVIGQTHEKTEQPRGSIGEHGESDPQNQEDDGEERYDSSGECYQIAGNNSMPSVTSLCRD